MARRTPALRLRVRPAGSSPNPETTSESHVSSTAAFCRSRRRARSTPLRISPSTSALSQTGTKVLFGGTRRGLTPKLKTLLRRRSAIEPEIGHMKTDGRLSRCPLKGRTGDATFAVLCGCGHNLRKILAHLSALLTLFSSS